jgi:copper transport protein
LTALALAVTSVHVAAMTVWFGGLVVLLAVLLRRGADPAPALAVLPRWSRIAFGSVVALVLSGVVQSVREVGSVAALVSTVYGWTLVAKLALVVVLIGAAGVSRAWVQERLGVGSRRRVTAHAFAAQAGDTVSGTVDDTVDDAVDGAVDGAVDDTVGAAEAPARPGTATAADVRQLRRSVLLEVAVGAVVLALSAVLVGTAPADTAGGAGAQPVDVLVPLQGSSGANGSVEVSVSPARVGANTLHVTLLDAAGRLTQPRDITVQLTERAQQIGPLTVPLEPAGPGHYTTEAMDVPAAGTWTVTVTVRVDEFTAATAGTDVRVG